MLTTFNLGQFPRRAKLRRPDIGFVAVTNGSHATAVSHDIGNWRGPVKEPAISAHDGYGRVSRSSMLNNANGLVPNWAEAAGKNWFIQDGRFIGDVGFAWHTRIETRRPLSPPCYTHVCSLYWNEFAPRPVIYVVLRSCCVLLLLLVVDSRATG